MKSRVLRGVASYCVWGILLLSPVFAEPSDDAEQVRDTLIVRTEQINSLRLQYTLRGPKNDHACDFRFSDRNCYFFQDSELDNNEHRLHAVAFLNGVVTPLEGGDAPDRLSGGIMGFQEHAP